MTFESNKFFEMHEVLNKLRSIEQQSNDSSIVETDPGMENSGKKITDANFTRTMARINSLKGAVGKDKFNDLRNGIKAIYANHRPNTPQMSALLELLETILGYVADDVTLYNRLRSDITGKDDDVDDEDTGPLGADEQDEDDETPEDDIVDDEPRKLKI